MPTDKNIGTSNPKKVQNRSRRKERSNTPQLEGGLLTFQSLTQGSQQRQQTATVAQHLKHYP